MVSNKGTFITLEGGEGSGKTTLIESLEAQLHETGREVVTTFEPGATLLGQEIRQLLLAHRDEDVIDPFAELLLFLSDRAQHLATTIRPALERGGIVLCDRFNDSTIAYQGFARGLDISKVIEFCNQTVHEIQPDLTLYLDIDPEVGLKRAQQVLKEEKGDEDKDRIESEAFTFHTRLRQGFHWLAEQHPDRIVVIDATLPKEEVLQQASEALQNRLSIETPS